MWLVAAFLLLFAFAQPGLGADAAELIAAMKQSRLSEGFEARMQVSVVEPDGRRLPPFKLSVVGQVGAERQRLRIRGISPDPVRGRFVAAERDAVGHIRALGYAGPSSGSVERVEPTAGLFDSGLVPWDMLGAWWDWPRQSVEGSDRIDGRTCTLVRSRTDDEASSVREVLSCVNEDTRLSLRTQLYDHRRRLLRTIAVKQTMRKESGALVAKKLTVAEADRTTTEVEVYSGDEHYLVTSDTFASLDSGK